MQIGSVRAVRIREPGDVDVLDLVDVPLRAPGPGELLIDVAAAGLNRADILQRLGLYPAPPGAPADIPGLEYAGRVAAIGEGVTAFSEGDTVMGLVGGGAMASRLVAHERRVIRTPKDMPLHEAAAIPEVFTTAYDAMLEQAHLSVGQVVLIHSVAGGVGTAALQLARIVGAQVVGTSRSAQKLEACRELGLETSILVSDGRFAEELHHVTGGHLADVIVDTVGAAYLAENLRAVARCGTMVVVGLLGGVTGEISLTPLLTKRVRIQGTVLRSRTFEEKASLGQAVSRKIVPLFEQGRIRPVIDRVMPMHEIREAHRRLQANETLGKIVLTW